MAKISANTWMLIATIGVIGLVLVYSGYKLPGMSVSPLQVPVTQGGALCDNGNNQPQVTWGQYWVDPTNNNLKTAASDVAAYFIPGEAIARFGTSAAGSNTTTAGALACGQNYNLILGDGGNGTYYYSAVAVPALAKTQINLAQVEIKRAGAPTISMSNSSSFETAILNMPNTTFLTGAVDTQTMKIVISKTNDGTVFGDRGWGICFRYNGTGFDWWHPQTAYISEYQQGVIQGATGKTKVQCFKMSETGITGGKIEIGIEAKCGAATSCAGQTDAVDIYLQDFTGIPFNGALVTGVDNTVAGGASTDVGRSNPNLQTAIVFFDG